MAASKTFESDDAKQDYLETHIYEMLQAYTDNEIHRRNVKILRELVNINSINSNHSSDICIAWILKKKTFDNFFSCRTQG